MIIPVEWGKFGRLFRVADFLRLPEGPVRRLRNMGRIRLRNGRITPEDLREDWNAYANELGAGDGGPVVPHPRPRLIPTFAPAPALGGRCAPIMLRIPNESGGGSQVFPRAARVRDD